MYAAASRIPPGGSLGVREMASIQLKRKWNEKHLIYYTYDMIWYDMIWYDMIYIYIYYECVYLYWIIYQIYKISSIKNVNCRFLTEIILIHFNFQINNK